ncbi:methyltransferase domain-containing protein [Amycolatopsis sp. NPDC059027]|uniref:methyltransferase domain-containing protein n=1 Tax=unclassified Amycolatopsis TaxID=2618356 RepID=UPI00366B4326
MHQCRICDGDVTEFFDFGRQPISDAFRRPADTGDEFFFRLAAGVCRSCTMVQLLEEVPRARMFHQDYPYRTSESTLMAKHFEKIARRLLETELSGPDPFVVEIGSNDGVMLRTVSEAGVRHLGVDPSGGAAEVAATAGVRVRTDFFEESSAVEIRAADGPADVIFSANTTSHIAYIDSVFRGVDVLLADHGVFVFEERYLADIIGHTKFDQIYDEHFYLLSVRSVSNMAARFGFQLVDVEHLAVHGGAIRYTVARPHTRTPTAAVAEFLDAEEAAGLTDLETFRRFGQRVEGVRDVLMTLLWQLRAEGKRVIGYGATAKSATVTNYCGITTETVPFVCDSTASKQGKLMPGSRIPVRPPSDFSNPYPDYALLFAWNHAEEIMAKERAFRESGGKWILYIPDVHVV